MKSSEHIPTTIDVTTDEGREDFIQGLPPELANEIRRLAKPKNV